MSEPFEGMVRVESQLLVEAVFDRFVSHEEKFKSTYKKILDEFCSHLQSQSYFGWRPYKRILSGEVETREDFQDAVRSIRWEDREERKSFQVALDLAKASGDGWVYLPYKIALSVYGRDFTLSKRTKIE